MGVMSRFPDPTLILTGEMCRLRHVIYLDGIARLLRGTPYNYLVRLAVARIIKHENGWISRSELGHGDSDIARQVLYILRKDVHYCRRSRTWDVYECDDYKRVRLLALPHRIIIENAVELLPDAEIRSAVELIKKNEATMTPTNK